MCRIPAIFALDPRAEPVDRTELRTIRDPMRTRGPDAAARRLRLDHSMPTSGGAGQRWASSALRATLPP